MLDWERLRGWQSQHGMVSKKTSICISRAPAMWTSHLHVMHSTCLSDSQEPRKCRQYDAQVLGRVLLEGSGHLKPTREPIMHAAETRKRSTVPHATL